MLLSSAILEYLLHLRIEKNSSERTLEQYERHLLRFLSFMDTALVSQISHFPALACSVRRGEFADMIQILIASSSTSLASVLLDQIRSFRLHLVNSWSSIPTANAYMITLRSFMKYCLHHDLPHVSPEKILLSKIRDKHIRFLSKEAMRKFMATILPGRIQDTRDYAIICLIYSTGLRISELTALNRRNFQEHQSEITVLWKGWKLRTVFLTPWAQEALEKYLSQRNDHFEPLFIRHNFSQENIQNQLLDDASVRLTRFFITQMIRQRGITAGIPHDISAHSLRHSFATTLLSAGADIRSIQEMLWHQSIATTQIYTHVTNPHLKKIHQGGLDII